MSTKPKKTSRAGRDLPAAIGVGVTLGAGIIAIPSRAADLVRRRLGRAGDRDLGDRPATARRRDRNRVLAAADRWSGHHLVGMAVGTTGILVAAVTTVLVSMVWKLPPKVQRRTQGLSARTVRDGAGDGVAAGAGRVRRPDRHRSDGAARWRR